MSQFKFHEVVIGIIVGDIEEGTKFKTSTGFDAVFKDGTLSWITSGGYLGSPIAVTDEILGETFYVVNPTVKKELSFSEAIQYIAEGDEVEADIEGRIYILNRLADVDSLIEDMEYFGDFYKAKFTVELEDAKELPFSDKPKSTGNLYLVEPEQSRAGIKLGEQEAWEILNKYTFGRQSVEQLAKDYGVSTRMIYYILDGTHWKNIHDKFVQSL